MLYKIMDDLECKARGLIPSIRPYLRKGLPSSVRIRGGSGGVKLSPEWMQFVRDINVGRGYKYHYTNKKRTAFKNSVGWHNKGPANIVEQVTFSGNIVDVYSIIDNRAYIRCYYNDQKPPAPVWPKVRSLHPLVQLLTTQFANKLDRTTNSKYPRLMIIANPGERLWIDIANLKPV